MALFVTLFLGLFFLIGIFVVMFSHKGERIELMSVAVALGAMVGIGLLDIIPEIIEVMKETGDKRFYMPIAGAIFGFFVLVLLDRFIPEHEEDDDDDYSAENMVHIGMISSIAIVLHNIIEGMAVYSLSSSSINQGIMLMIGIGLHNIPMGMFIFSTLRSKTGWKRNLLISTATLSTFVGGLIMMRLEKYMSIGLDEVLFGIALGMIIYIVAMELLPYVRKHNDKKTSIICTLIGMVVVLISVLME